MNSANQLIEQAQSVGIELFLEGQGKVKVRYPETRRVEVSPILALLRAHREEVARALRARNSVETLAPCGRASCAGCYSAGLIDGRERFIHPPRPSPEWLRWLAKWEPKTGAKPQ